MSDSPLCTKERGGEGKGGKNRGLGAEQEPSQRGGNFAIGGIISWYMHNKPTFLHTEGKKKKLEGEVQRRIDFETFPNVQ